MVEMMAERGPAAAHATVVGWVQRYAPEFEERGGVRASSRCGRIRREQFELGPRGRSRASRGDTVGNAVLGA